MVFERPNRLWRHLNGTGKFCWPAVKARVGIRCRETAVRKRIAKRLQHGTFLSFLISTVKRQRKEAGNAPVFFIPYGPTSLLTAELFQIVKTFRHNVNIAIRAQRGGAGRQELRTRVLATAFGISLFCTSRAADAIGLLPAEWNDRYEASLRACLDDVAKRKLVLASSAFEVSANYGLSVYNCVFFRHRPSRPR